MSPVVKVLSQDLRASQIAWIFGTLVIAAMLAGSVAWTFTLRESEIESWRRQMSSMSLLIAEHASQTMLSAYLVLDTVAEQVKHEGLDDINAFRRKMATPEIHQMLREKILGLPQIDVAAIIAANGDNLNFSRSYPVMAINVAERDYFKAHLDDPVLGDFISMPVRNKANGKCLAAGAEALSASALAMEHWATGGELDRVRKARPDLNRRLAEFRAAATPTV